MFRIKPDILAPGSGLYSARSEGETKVGKERLTCTTTYKKGTSMSTPVVAGHITISFDSVNMINFHGRSCCTNSAIFSG